MVNEKCKNFLFNFIDRKHRNEERKNFQGGNIKKVITYDESKKKIEQNLKNTNSFSKNTIQSSKYVDNLKNSLLSQNNDDKLDTISNNTNPSISNISDITNTSSINTNSLITNNSNISKNLSSDKKSLLHEKNNNNQIKNSIESNDTFSHTNSNISNINDSKNLTETLVNNNNSGILGNSIKTKDSLTSRVDEKNKISQISNKKSINNLETKDYNKNTEKKITLIPKDYTKEEMCETKINSEKEKDYYKIEKYIGEIKNKEKNGKGIQYYKSGDKYDGYWENNKKNGKGTIYYNNGDIFIG